MGIHWTTADLEGKGFTKGRSGIYDNKTPIKKSGNKKVRNATPCESEGVKYKSKLERYMSVILRQNKIEYVYERKFTIHPGFIFHDEKVLKITHKPDFFIPSLNLIIETKGHITQSYRNICKLFKKHLIDSGLNYKFIMPRTQKDCRAVIDLILRQV
mgnify:CR=1 FL=1